MFKQDGISGLESDRLILVVESQVQIVLPMIKKTAIESILRDRIKMISIAVALMVKLFRSRIFLESQQILSHRN